MFHNNHNKEGNNGQGQTQEGGSLPGLLKKGQNSKDSTTDRAPDKLDLTEWKKYLLHQIAEISKKKKSPLEKLFDFVDASIEWDDFFEEQEQEKKKEE